MSAQNEVYDKLAEKYRLVGDAHFLELLELYMTPEEGQYLLEADNLSLSNPTINFFITP